MDSQARSAVILYGSLLIIAVLLTGLAIGCGIGFIINRYEHDRRCEALLKAAELDNQSAFWRDEAFRAYEEHR